MTDDSDSVAAAGAEAERAVAEHCGVPVADISVRHTRLSHPGSNIERIERLVIEWVDRDDPPAEVVDEIDNVTDIDVAPEDLVWTGDGYELREPIGGVER